jgi:molybdopterin molybdotransferase
MPVEEAKALILAGVKTLSAEFVPLGASNMRVLARDLSAKRDQPPFPASAMDGFAVNSSDVDAPGRQLRLIGISAAGHGFRRSIGKGEAVRIFTGAPVPRGADAVLIQESAVVDEEWITAQAAVKPGQHVRPRGLDFRKGETLLRQGQVLGPRDIGLAASMNYPVIPVRRMPKVAIFATGDELVDPGSQPRADQIFASNSLALAAFAAWAGAEPKILATAQDREKDLRHAIRQARNADILITTGGASVGEHDLVKSALHAEGIALTFWKIAMRPGKPLMFATRKHQRIIGLPGNPVSAMVCARVFIKPLLDRLLGRVMGEKALMARLTVPMPANDERQEYARARLERKENGSLLVTPYPMQDSSMLRVLAEADCLIIRKPHAQAAATDEMVEIIPIEF